MGRSAPGGGGAARAGWAGGPSGRERWRSGAVRADSSFGRSRGYDGRVLHRPPQQSGRTAVASGGVLRGTTLGERGVGLKLRFRGAAIGGRVLEGSGRIAVSRRA